MGLLDRFRGVQTRSGTTVYSIQDPALLAWWMGHGQGIEGIQVTELSALSIPAYWRAINLIAGTIATLPLKTYEDQPVNGGPPVRQRVVSFLDKPAGPYPLTPSAWKRLVITHELQHGEAFLQHIYNGAGALVGLWPVLPTAVSVYWDLSAPGYKRFSAQMLDGTMRDFDGSSMTQVMGLTLDGLRGISPLMLFKMGISLSIAGEHAQGRSFGGAQIAGLVTPEEDISAEDAKLIHDSLMEKVGGVAHVNDVAVVNRPLKYNAWAQNNVESQFQEGRRFQIDETARMFGIPGHLLDETKTSSWGTGIEIQNRGLASFVLRDWTTGLQEALSELLPDPQFAEFDYTALLQGSPAEEVTLLIAEAGGPILTVDEARAIRNLPPMKMDAPVAPDPSTPPGETP